MDEPLLTGLWAVVQLGPRMFLACLTDYKTDAQHKAEADFLEGKAFRLSSVLDYYSPIQRVQKDQQVGVQREPLVMPFEFTSTPTKILAKPDMLCFLNDMSNDDRKIYISFISTAEKAMTETRIGRAGLVMPGNNGGIRRTNA